MLVKKAPAAHPVTITAGRILFSIPVLWAIVLVKGIPTVDENIIFVIVLSAPIEVIALVMYMRALQISPMYKTLPFLAFTPILLILTSWIMMEEAVSLGGTLGIACIVLGTYSLYFQPKENLLMPFKTVLDDKGSLLMLITAFLYSITANFGKMGVLYSSPYFFGALYFTILGVILIVWTMAVDSVKNIFSRHIVVIGVTQSIMITFHMAALELAPVSYMISVKRSSMLFGIIFGSLFFGERNVLQHGIAVIVILIGIAFIGFAG